jgi:hypothetical protein
MAQAHETKQDEAARLWRERFGQPPPIVADADTMLAIIRSFAPPRAAPRNPCENPLAKPHRGQ